MDEIMSLADKIAKLQQSMYKKIAPEVEKIIEKEITDIDKIEYYLTKLLDIPTAEGYSLLKRLCKYYMKLNPKAAEFYLRAYGEMYELPSKSKVKKRAQ